MSSAYCSVGVGAIDVEAVVNGAIVSIGVGEPPVLEQLVPLVLELSVF